MNYPSLLEPNGQEEIELPSGKILVPKKQIQLKEWRGEKINNTFGEKPLVDFNGIPFFVELAILKIGQIASWEGRWIETYAMKKEGPYFFENWLDDHLKKQKSIAIENETIKALLKKIATQNGGYSGCWDLLLWKGENFVFIECKKNKEDKLRKTQLNWLDAALMVGVKKENFVLLEWNF